MDPSNASSIILGWGEVGAFYTAKHFIFIEVERNEENDSLFLPQFTTEFRIIVHVL